MKAWRKTSKRYAQAGVAWRHAARRKGKANDSFTARGQREYDRLNRAWRRRWNDFNRAHGQPPIFTPDGRYYLDATN